MSKLRASTMKLPLSVVKPARSCGNAPSAARRRPTKLCAIGITSSGSGNAPSRATNLPRSAMHTKRALTCATIFSRVSAPPPPLIKCKWRVASSAPSTYSGNSPTWFKSNTAMPRARRRCAEASELATVPSILLLIFAKPSMKKFAVEPVPTPTTSPIST